MEMNDVFNDIIVGVFPQTIDTALKLNFLLNINNEVVWKVMFTAGMTYMLVRYLHKQQPLLNL